NATDFRLLTWADWLVTPSENQYDFVVLPGTKNTIADLTWLRASGLAEWVLGQHARGATIVGICGGYQMLGRVIGDPRHMESTPERADGLGLLPMSTELAADKRTQAVTATTPSGVRFGGYEIHLGVSVFDETAPATTFAVFEDGSGEGIRMGRVIGT